MAASWCPASTTSASSTAGSRPGSPEPSPRPPASGGGSASTRSSGSGPARRPTEGTEMATATLIDGKRVAEQVKLELADRIAVLQLQDIRPGLGTILVGDDPGSRSYV